jgi:hypothetical protein
MLSTFLPFLLQKPFARMPLPACITAFFRLQIGYRFVNSTRSKPFQQPVYDSTSITVRKAMNLLPNRAKPLSRSFCAYSEI